MNRIADVIDRVGSSELARRLGCSKQMVSHWRVGRYKPTAEAAVEIELVTNGLITRSDLRPDLWPPATPYHLPPTAPAEAA